MKAYSKSHMFQTNIGTGTVAVGTPTDVSGLSYVGFQVIGLNTGTVQWEANITSGDLFGATTTWIAVRATNQNSGTAGTTASGDGIFSMDTRGYVSVRANITTLSIVNNGRLDVYGYIQGEI